MKTISRERPRVNPVPKPTGDKRKLLSELKKANQEVVVYGRKFAEAKLTQARLLAQLLEDVEIDQALLELDAVQI